MVFFGDIVVLKAIMVYYDFKYVKISIYEKPTAIGYYAGEKKFDRWFPEVNQYSPENYAKDIAFTMLMSGDLDYIDYIDYRVQAPITANILEFI